MRHRIRLPPSLGPVFVLSDAVAAGVGRWRGSAPDLDRPFRSVRATSAPDTFLTLVECYRPRMREHHRLVGWTAVRLWGLPTPHRWTPLEPIEVAVPRDGASPHGPRVRGRRLDAGRAQTWIVHHVQVVDPIAAVFTVARDLSPDHTVVLLDALLSRADGYPGLLPGRPLIDHEEIARRLTAWHAFPGSARIRAALPHARTGAESPKETETRLLLRRAGLPEPVLQYEVCEGDRVVARLDLSYPELRIAIEYEGDGHRTDAVQWRRDIQRQRDLEDLGWIVVRLTQQDLRSGSASLVSRIRHAIASRTSRR
ncbi:hypothetical protein [Microbacterium soli]|uniref:DUF559 domain-containing protein n=1 Tax=Microbacterium soli TaxID=446075 RepID=A0ABP7N7X2_9MICO